MKKMKIGEDYTLKYKSIDKAYLQFYTEKVAAKTVRKTIAGYDFAWRLFEKYLTQDLSKELNRPIEFSDIDKNTISAFTIWIDKNTKAGDVSKATYMKNLRTVLYYFMKEGFLGKFEVVIPHFTYPIQDTYTNEELEKLLKKPSIKKDDFKFTDYRNWVIFCYILDTSNRANTVINLKIKDIDLEYKRIYLHVVKNKKPHIIPLSNNLELILREYINIRKGEPEDYLFCTQYGEKLEYAGLRSAMERYNKSRNVNSVGIHKIRHTFGKLFVKNGGREFVLQQMLGHSTLTMSKRYVDLFSDDLMEIYNDKNPLGNFSNLIEKKKKIK